MRKIIVPLLVCVLLFSTIYAQEAEATEAEIESAETEFSNPGLLPDHPLYFFKKIKERVQLFLVFDDEGKAKLHLHLAKTRLAEAKRLIEKNKTMEAEDILEEYNLELERFEVRHKGIGRNVSTLVKESENVLQKSRIVLELVLAKAPEQARPGLERALNNSIEKEVRLKFRLENATEEERIEIREKIKEEIEKRHEIREKIREKIEKKLEERQERIKEREGVVCIQVITPAKNPRTGECKDFPTPCDVPRGWEKVDSCSELKIEEIVQTPIV